MPSVNPARVPIGLRDLTKNLARKMLREKPTNIYEYSAQYFETMIQGNRDFENRGFEPTSSYETILKSGTGQVQTQIPLSLIYAIIPEEITELIKEFIKAVLRTNPDNICVFAVQYFRDLKERDFSSKVKLSSYENFLKSTQRFPTNSFAKCACGRILYEGLSERVAENKNSSKICATEQENYSDILNIKQEQSKIGKIISKNNAHIVSKWEIDTGENIVNAVLTIQRLFRRAIKKRKAMEESSNFHQKHTSMSEDTAAFIIQRTLRKLFNNSKAPNKNLNEQLSTDRGTNRISATIYFSPSEASIERTNEADKEKIAIKSEASKLSEIITSKDISTSSEACNANRSEESSYIENDQPIMKQEQETYQFNPEHKITLGHPFASKTKTDMINNKSQRLHAKQTISDNKISPGVNNNIPIEKKFIPNDLLELEEETVYGSPPACSKITADHRNKEKDTETACNVTDESSSIVSEDCFSKNIEERKTASNDQEKISNLIVSGSQIDENLLSFENQVNFGAGANANCTIRKDYSNLVESDQQIPSHIIGIANMAEGPEIDGAPVSPNSDSDIKIDKDAITEDQIESNKSKNIIFEKVISHPVTHGDKYNNNVSSLEETDSNLILKNTNENSAITNAEPILKNNDDTANVPRFEVKDLLSERIQEHINENYELPPHSNNQITPKRSSDTAINKELIPKGNEEKGPSSFEIKEVISDKTDAKVFDNCESAPHLDETISLASEKVSEAITNAQFILKNNDYTTNVPSFEDKKLIPAGSHEKMDENFESPPHSYEHISVAPNKGSETFVKETILSKSNEEIKKPSSCEIKDQISDKTNSKVADNCESASHLDETISLASDKVSEVITNAKFILKNNDDTTNVPSFEDKELIPAGSHDKMDENFESPPHSYEQISIAPNKGSEISIKETILSKSNEEIKNPSSCEIKEVFSDKSVERVADNNESVPHLIESISLVPVKVPEAVTNAKFTLKENENATNESSFEAEELIPARNQGKMDENYESPPHSTKPVAIAPNKVAETSVKETIISKSNEEIKSPSSCEIEEEISDKTDSKVADNCESAPHLGETISLASDKVSEVITNAKFLLKDNDDTTIVPSFEDKELIPAGNHEKMDENFISPPHEQISIAPNKGSEIFIKETIISKSNEEIKSPPSCEIKEVISDKSDEKVADNNESVPHLIESISLVPIKVPEAVTSAKFTLKENQNATNESSFEAKELTPGRNHDKMDENFISPPHEQISIAPNKGSATSIKETILSKSNEEIKNPSSCEIKEVISDKSVERVADNNESVPHLIESISLVPVKVPEVVTNAKFTLKENEIEVKELIPARNHEKMDENYESPPHSTKPIAIAPDKVSETSVKETIISKSNKEIKSPSSCEIEEVFSDKTDSKVADNYESASHLDKAISLASDKVSEVITKVKFILKDNDNTTIVPSFEDKELIPAGNHEKMDENFISPPYEQISIAPNKGSEILIKETIISKSNEEIKNPSSCEIKKVISDKKDESVADNNESVPHLIESISLVPIKEPEAVTNAKVTLKENQNATNESSFEAKELIPARNQGQMDENYESPPHSTKPVAIAPNKVSETSVKGTIISKSNEEIKSPSSCEIEEEISDKTDSKVADNCESAPHLGETISLASDKVSEVITNAKFLLKDNDDTTIVPSFEDKELIPAGNHEKMDENFISPPHEQISIAPNKGSEIFIKETIISKSNEEIKNPSSREIKEVISDKSDEKVADNNESVPHLIESISLVPIKEPEAVTNAKVTLKENQNATNESSFEAKVLTPGRNHDKMDENFISPPHEQISIAPNKGSATSIKETILSKSNEKIKNPSSCEIKEVISDKSVERVADNNESVPHLIESISLVPVKVPEAVTNAKFTLKENEIEAKELIPARNHEKMDENYESPPHSTKPIAIAPDKVSETSAKETIISKSSEEIKSPSSCEIEEVFSDKTDSKVADNCESASHLDKAIALASDKVSEVITNAKFILKNNDDTSNVPSFEGQELVPARNHEKMDENFISPPHEQISIAPNKGSEISIKETILSKSNEEIKNPSSCEIKEVISDKSVEKVADNNDSVPHLIESISLVPVKVSEFTLKENQNATNESSFEAEELIPARNQGKMDENYESPPHSTKPVAIAPNKVSETSVKETIIPKGNEEIKCPSSCEIKEVISDKSDEKVADNCESASHSDQTISFASDKESEVITNSKFVLKNNDDATNVPSFDGKELVPAENHEKMDENFISPPHEQISIAPNKGSEISIKETILSKSNEEIKNPSSCEIKEVISDKSVERVADNNESVPHLIESISLVPVKVTEAVTNAKFTLKENQNATNESSFEAKELIPAGNHEQMDGNYESPPHSNKALSIAPNKVSETSIKETIISKSNDEIKNPPSFELKEVISNKSDAKVFDNCESTPHLDEIISPVPNKLTEVITSAKFILKDNEDATNESSFEAKEEISKEAHEKMDENFDSSPHSNEQISIALNKSSDTAINEETISRANEEKSHPSSLEMKEIGLEKPNKKFVDYCESRQHLINKETISNEKETNSLNELNIVKENEVSKNNILVESNDTNFKYQLTIPSCNNNGTENCQTNISPFDRNEIALESQEIIDLDDSGNNLTQQRASLMKANGNFTSDNIIGSRNPNGVVGTNNSKPNVERMMYQKKTKQSNKDNVKDNVKDHFIGRPLDARVAEIHLKSFKTDVKMPWYENGTLINTEFRNEISKNDIECTSPRNRQNSSGIVFPLPTVGDVCNKTEILNSLTDSACEKDSLEISSPKETDIEEDSLEIGLITEDKPPRKIKNNAEDRTATYLYGASIQQANVAHKSKHLKKSTAFIIPFTTNKDSIVNNSSNNTRNEVLNKSGVQTECIFPNESTSERKHLNETGNAIHYNIEHTETPIDMECQKKLFQDLKKVEGLTGIKSENTETTEEELHFRKTSLQDTARFYLSKPDNHFTAKSYELIKEQKSMNTLNAETFGRNNSFDEIEGGEFTINGLDTIIEVNEGDNKDGMKNENETDFSSETASDLSSSWTESKESDEFILSEEFEGIFETLSSNRPKSFNTIAEVQGGIYETKKIKINADEELGLEGRNLKSKHKNNLLNYTEKENNSAESSLTLLIKMGIEDQDTSESKSKNCNSQETTSINATKSKYEEDVSKNRHQAAAAIQSNSAKYLAASIIQRNIRRYLDGKRKEMNSGFPGKQEGLPVNLESGNTNKSEFQVSFNSETTLKEAENLKKDYRDRYESSHEINIEEPHVNQHNKRKNLITSKKWTNEKAAAVIQKAYKTYLDYKCKKRNTEISQAVHKYNNKLSANQCTSKKNSLVESDATPCPTSESKVNWFVGVEPIKTSMELNKITQNLPDAKPLSNNYESGPAEVNINTALISPEDSIGIQRNLQRDADPISNTYFIPRNQDSGEDGAQVNNSISETIQDVYNFLFAERRLYLKSRDETNQQIIDDSKSFDYSECIETCVPFEHLQKFAETTQNEGGENHFIVEAANKLRGTDELVDNMQKRLLCRSNSFDSANEKVRRQRSFEEPVIWAMQDIQESKKSTPDTEDDKVVVKPMEIEDTRESSGLSESIIISHMSIDEDENDRLENPLKIEEAFERHFTKPLEDSELSVGTIMNDNVEEYFHSEKHTYKNKTNSCSIYLDDDTSENIRKKMMASSLTETESDASDDPISDSRATQLTDFNICTIINDTTGTSSDTESTIISTAEKAHGVDNSIRLKSDDTIDQSSEILRNTVARRMTFQRGDAILNDSMPDEEKLCSTNIEQQKGSIEKYVSHSKERNVPEHTSYKLKWLSMRQNSMPVQIDSEIFRVIPKHMRKRNKSADESRKTSKRLLKE